MPPLGLLYIAAHLRAIGSEPILIDRNSFYFNELKNEVEEKKYELLDEWTLDIISKSEAALCGFTMMTSQMHDVKRLSKKIRKQFTSTLKMVVGGYQSSLEPEATLSYLENVDVAVCGRGETSIGLLAKNAIPLESIPNIVYRIPQKWWHRLTPQKNNSLFGYGPRVRPQSEDKLYYEPARDLLDINFYSHESDSIISCYHIYRPFSLITSLGCIHNCSFCASRILEKSHHHKEVDRVIAEIDTLVSTYSASALLFYDINFFVHKRRTQALLEAMASTFSGQKLRWLASASATELPPEQLNLARKAGCIGLVFGFESGSDKMLEKMNKTARISDNQKAIDLCNEFGIRPQSGFIVGYPGETERDLTASFEFIEKNSLLSSLNLILPLPGTPINKQLVEQGRLKRDDPNYYGLISDHNRPLSEKIVFSDMPYERFVELFNFGHSKICAPTWKTMFVDQPRSENTGV